MYGVDLKDTVKDVNEANSNLKIGNEKMAGAISRIDSLQKIIYSIRDSVKEAQFNSLAALSEIDKTRNNIKQRNDSLVRSIKFIKDNATAEINSLHTQSSIALRKANKALSQINLAKDTAIVVLATIKRLTPSQEQALNEEKEQNPGRFRTSTGSISSKLWKSGAVIKVFFLDGTPTQRSKARQIAQQWTDYANLKFQFINNRDNSDVRITFQQKDLNWSYLGTASLAIPKNSPTMSLGSVKDKTEIEDFERNVILREFGFTLGLQQEQNNPNCAIKWNKDKVYQYCQQQGLTTERIDDTFFRKWSSSDYPIKKECDLKSVMMFQIPSELTLDGVGSGLNTVLSNIDKVFIAKIYPK